MQTCWTVIVAAELLGAIYGIGKVLSSAKDDVYPGNDSGRHDHGRRTGNFNDVSSRVGRTAVCNMAALDHPRVRKPWRASEAKPRRWIGALGILVAGPGLAGHGRPRRRRIHIGSPDGRHPAFLRNAGSAVRGKHARMAFDREPWPLSSGFSLAVIDRRTARLDDELVPEIRSRGHAILQFLPFHRADRLGSFCDPLVRHRFRRTGTDHLQRRIRALRDRQL